MSIYLLQFNVIKIYISLSIDFNFQELYLNDLSIVVIIIKNKIKRYKNKVFE